MTKMPLLELDCGVFAQLEKVQEELSEAKTEYMNENTDKLRKESLDLLQSALQLVDIVFTDEQQLQKYAELHYEKLNKYQTDITRNYKIVGTINIDINKNIKQCQNCGKYFSPKRSDQKYCQNIFKGNRTCKQIGYENKIKDNEIIKAYRTAYKTHHAMIRNNKMNNFEFGYWVLNAKEMKNAVINGKITIEEFKQWLKK